MPLEGKLYEKPREDPRERERQTLPDNPIHLSDHVQPTQADVANSNFQHDQNNAVLRAAEENDHFLEHLDDQDVDERENGRRIINNASVWGPNLEQATATGKTGISMPDGIAVKLPNLIEAKAIRHRYAAKEPIELSLLASKLLTEKGFYITPESLKQLLKDKRHHGEFAVLDLRTQDPNVQGDVTTLEIPNAEHFELKDVLDPKIKELDPRFTTRSKAEANWKQLMTQPPFTEICDKPLLIIHCSESISRTPAFASAYVEFVAQHSGQQVALLQGGFTAWQTLAAADPNSKELCTFFSANEFECYFVDEANTGQ